jgi:hypothetical protein
MIKYLIILFSVWLIITLAWYYKPTSFLNIKTKTKSKNKIEDFEGPMLIIATHAYCHADSIIVCNESRKSKNKFNIVARKDWSQPIEQFFRELPLFTHYNKIDALENQKNNNVEKSVKILSNNENVVFLLQRNKKSTGIYYILEKTKVPILFLRIYKKGEKDIQGFKECTIDKSLLNVINEDFELEYEKIDNYPIDKKPEDFIEWVHQKLYN